VPIFLKIGQGVSELAYPEKRHFPLKAFIALTTVSALPCCTVIDSLYELGYVLSKGTIDNPDMTFPSLK